MRISRHDQPRHACLRDETGGQRFAAQPKKFGVNPGGLLNANPFLDQGVLPPSSMPVSERGPQAEIVFVFGAAFGSVSSGPTIGAFCRFGREGSYAAESVRCRDVCFWWSRNVARLL
jgi:hypothetical protein